MNNKVLIFIIIYFLHVKKTHLNLRIFLTPQIGLETFSYQRLVIKKKFVIFFQNIFGNLYPRHILGLAGDTGSELVPGESSLETKQQ